MTLPAANKRLVSREKVAGYLLNPAHPDNGGKAEFFIRLGFTCERWEILAAALNTLADESEMIAAGNSLHGKKFVLTGRILSPGGRTSLVQSIWIVDKGQDKARLVTAYPRKA